MTTATDCRCTTCLADRELDRASDCRQAWSAAFDALNDSINGKADGWTFYDIEDANTTEQTSDASLTLNLSIDDLDPEIVRPTLAHRLRHLAEQLERDHTLALAKKTSPYQRSDQT